MNITNVFSAMWTISQGMPFLVVNFQADNYEYKQLCHSVQPAISSFTYSDISPLVHLSREALKSKTWILIIVGGERLCGAHSTEENFNEDDIDCVTVTSKLTSEKIAEIEQAVEYLTLTRWLIPHATPISANSSLLCLVVYDDFTDVPRDYRRCSQRSSFRVGSNYREHIDCLSTGNFRTVAYSTGVEVELQRFLNLSCLVSTLVQEPYADIELWRRLRLRQLDIIMDDFIVTFDRLNVISFTSSLNTVQSTIVSKSRSSQPLGSLGLVKVFDIGTWICVGLTIAIFYGILSTLRRRNAFVIVLATQLSISLEVKPRRLGILMFLNGLLLNCAFSSGLLSSLNTSRSSQIATIADFIAELRKPHTSVCLFQMAFHNQLINDQVKSGAFAALARLKAAGRLIRAVDRNECFQQARTSTQVFAIINFVSYHTFADGLFFGREPIYVSTSSYPISPSHPMRKQMTVFVGCVRETHLLVRRYHNTHLNETLRELYQRRRHINSVNVLTLNDVGVSLFVLFASWIAGLLVEMRLLLSQLRTTSQRWYKERNEKK